MTRVPPIERAIIRRTVQKAANLRAPLPLELWFEATTHATMKQMKTTRMEANQAYVMALRGLSAHRKQTLSWKKSWIIICFFGGGKRWASEEVGCEGMYVSSLGWGRWGGGRRGGGG